ncbi:hypothetical protein [Parapedomonas caeni]
MTTSSWWRVLGARLRRAGVAASGDTPAPESPAPDIAAAAPGADCDVATRVDMLMRAADMHLRRAVALAETEWKVTILFWGGMVTTGISFIAYSSGSSPPMANYIAYSDWVFFLAYMLAAGVFLFGFSINQATSIIEERRQYQACQNEAAALAGVTARARTGGQLADPQAPLHWTLFLRSKVWTTKAMATYLFITGVWISSQWLAHGRVALAGGAGPEAEHFPNPACAFADCHMDNSFDWNDSLEPGTWLWLLGFLLVTFLFVRSFRAGDR